jgi:hypothetical protein
VPNHPFFEKAVDRLGSTVGSAPTPSQEAGPGYLTKLVQEDPMDLAILPRETFYSALTIDPPQRPADFPSIFAVHHHLESYRGDDPDVVRDVLGRRLHEAQIEIERLQNELAGARAEVDARVAKISHRLEKVGAHLERHRSSRWWRLGRALRVVKT